MVDGARLLALRVRVPTVYELLVVRLSPRQSSAFYLRRGDIILETANTPFLGWGLEHRTGVLGFVRKFAQTVGSSPVGNGTFVRRW